MTIELSNSASINYLKGIKKPQGNEPISYYNYSLFLTPKIFTGELRSEVGVFFIEKDVLIDLTDKRDVLHFPVVSKCFYRDDALSFVYDNGIVIVPSNIETGFIFEDIIKQVYVWNSSRSSIRNLKNITKTNLDAEYFVENVENYDMAQEEELMFNLVIPREGEIVVGGSFNFNFLDGYTGKLYITGLRLIIVPLKADKIYETIKYLTKITKTISIPNSETRRLVNDKVYMSFEYIKYNVDTLKDKLLKIIQYGYDKLLLLPILSLPIEANPISVGDDVLTLKSSVDKFVYKNCDISMVMVVDKNDYNVYYVSEIVGIDYNTNTITIKTKSNVSIQNPIVYPAKIMSLDEYSIKEVAHNLVDIDLKLSEYIG